MLKSIKITNFKAFGPEQTIPIKPLTLIYGTNSSGKSSIIQSLLLAHSMYAQKKVDVYKTNVGGDNVDLGGFYQYIHKRNAGSYMSMVFEFSDCLIPVPGIPINNLKRAKFSFGVKIGIPTDDEKRRQQLISKKKLMAKKIIEPQLMSLWIDINKIRHFTHEEYGDKDIGFNWSHPLSCRWIKGLANKAAKDDGHVIEYFSKLMKNIVLDMSSGLSLSIAHYTDESGERNEEWKAVVYVVKTFRTEFMIS